mmetsp:Transcript_18429/g.33029  ORF Transcript_18429/g.33029 Transcript_18429/m.33029 type:complete len:635 (-) Transcript_18429:167-2071(-)
MADLQGARVPYPEWKRAVDSQMTMQQRLIDLQQAMLFKLTEESRKTNQALRDLSTQVKILQNHILDTNTANGSANAPHTPSGGCSSPSMSTPAPSTFRPHLAKQLASLQASLLWTQRNVRLLKDDIKANKAKQQSKAPALSGFQTANTAVSSKNSVASKRLIVMQEQLDQLEKVMQGKATNTINSYIAESNRLLNKKLKPDPLGDRHFEVPQVSVGGKKNIACAVPGSGVREKSSGEWTPKDDQGAKEQALEREMLKCVDSWTTNREVQIVCATWNCNAKKPSEDLGKWLSCLEEKQPHIVAIGLQEVVELSVKHVLHDKERRKKPWEEAIQEALSGNGAKRYTQLISKQMVGIMVFIYVRNDIFPLTSNKDVCTVGCGKAGTGNKGAVVVRFQLYNVSMCIVNSHLAAHKENTLGRNGDFQKIMEKARFSTRTHGHPTRIENHDAVFWMGDLNYRLNFPAEDLGKVYKQIEQCNYSVLLEQDQLRAERIKGAVFQEFREGDITFAPTYKYTPHTNQYATGDGKNRMPAWCDRILWRAQRYAEVKQKWYRREDSLMASDHKPVVAFFDVNLKIIDPDKQATMFTHVSTKILEDEAVSADLSRRMTISKRPKHSKRIDNSLTSDTQKRLAVAGLI